MEELSFVARAKALVEVLPAQLMALHSYLVSTLGRTAAIAVYLSVAAIVLLAIFRSAKFSFDLLRFVILPTAAVGFLGSLLLPYSFATIAPFAAIVCSTLLLIRG
jgi:hypothetical protein